ncbi:hypothetical protein BD779DRAFT_1223487 [Infundibulicybe gibba]|nr:hypothetical protein BD779DRAFT_1223487 [Infundibulicybe gibba]
MDHPDIELAFQLRATKWYFVAGCALYAYSYVLTIEDELAVMWAGKRNTTFYLFIINRYSTMAFLVVTSFVYFSPIWTFEADVQ